jgi:hypothetical protein
VHTAGADLVRVNGQDSAQAVAQYVDNTEAGVEWAERVTAGFERQLEYVAHHLTLIK